MANPLPILRVKRRGPCGHVEIWIGPAAGWVLVVSLLVIAAVVLTLSGKLSGSDAADVLRLVARLRPF